MGCVRSDQEAQEMVIDFEGTLTVQEVAKFMHKSEVFVRAGLENGSLPIGSYDKRGGRASYYISPKRAYEWLGYRRHEENTDGYSTLRYVECITDTGG